MTQWDKIAETFKKIEDTSSSNEKKEIIYSILKEDFSNDLKFILYLTYSPYIKYNVLKVRPELYSGKIYQKELSLDELIDHLSLLYERKITGGSALIHLAMIYNSLPKSFQPYLERILQKDLKIGLGVGLINQIWKNFIPEFNVMLCERFKKIKLDQIKYPVIVEPKKDGVRALAFVDLVEGTVDIYARSGLKFENFKTLEKELLKANYMEGLHWVIDGEIQDTNFQQTMNNARRKYDVDTSNAIYTVWDIIPMQNILDNTNCEDKQFIRKIRLNQVFKDQPNADILFPHIKVIPNTLCSSFDEVMNQFNYWFDLGEEGVIVKNLDGLYEYKRSKDWFKIKIQDVKNGKADYTARIVDIYKGDENTKYKNTLGGFSCEFTFESQDIKFRVGSGFKDAQRIDFWARKDELMGKLIDVEAQEITVDKLGNYSLRFPIFKRFRGDL